MTAACDIDSGNGLVPPGNTPLPEPVNVGVTHICKMLCVKTFTNVIRTNGCRCITKDSHSIISGKVRYIPWIIFPSCEIFGWIPSSY